MGDLLAQRILAKWDRAAGRPPIARGSALLAAATGNADEAGLRALPLGARDRQLLELRSSLFGARVAGWVSCARCDERLEVEFDLSELGFEALPAPADCVRVAVADFVVDARHPAESDLLALSGSVDPVRTRRRLFERCVVAAANGNGPVAAETLPEPVVAAVSDALAAADPQADIELALVCPACGRHGTAWFDVASFLWSEIDAKATRVLRDVHALAAAYGWSETAILGLSPARRRFYLEMLGR
jgi:hypothetical protein